MNQLDRTLILKRFTLHFEVPMCARAGYLCIYAFLVASASASAQEAQSPPRDISVLHGDLYQAREGGHTTVFLVTGDGIVLADPLNTNFARWLKRELETRFPGRPVRYVVYTGHVYERTAGASVFNDSAEIVAHAEFPHARRHATRTLPASWTPFDQNGDSVIERSEAAALAPDWLTKDFNRDGEITAPEVWGDVASPEATFTTRRLIDIGGQRVEVMHPGDGLGPTFTAILFRAQRVLFAPLAVREAPESFAPTSPDAFADSLRQLEQLQFDTLVSHDGETATIGDVALMRGYVDELVAAVRSRFRKGNTVEEVQASLDLGAFSRLRSVDTRRGQNIAEAYRVLRAIRIEALGAGQLMLQPRSKPACALYAIPSIKVACKGVGGTAAAGMAAGAVMIGRFGGAVEFSGTGEVSGTEQTFGSAVTAQAHRERATAFMFRYRLASARKLQAVVTAGIARVTTTQRDSGYLSWVPDYELQSTASAKVIGADVTFAAGPISLLMPVRLTREPAVFESLPARRWNLRVGLGVTVPIARVVM